MRLMIESVDHKNRTFTCKIGNQLISFYLTNRLAKIFLEHLSEDVLVDFEITGKRRTVNNKKVFHVAYFNLIKNYKNDIVIYDHSKLKRDMVNFLDSNKHYLFLDLEMTMAYFRQKRFVPEIVQYGYLLVNDRGETVIKGSNYVETTLQKRINKRTISFLKLDINKYHESKISFKEFYNELDNVIKKYSPKIVVWGKNDIQALDHGYKIHNLKPVTNQYDFVDLLKLHKDYFNLHNDLGLFKAYETYYKEEINQVHDAKDDAVVTKKVFDAFIKYSKTDSKI